MVRIRLLSRGALVMSMVGVLVLGVIPIDVAMAAGTRRVSSAVGEQGIVQGNGHSATPSISSDGAIVAFTSDASNFVEGDTNGVSDVFCSYGGSPLNLLFRVSASSAGVQGNGLSGAPSISTLGIVAFASSASNLVADDIFGMNDIFVRQGQDVTRVSRASGFNDGSFEWLFKQGNAHSYEPSISSTGRFVAFSSASTNLVSEDTNGSSDVFVRDRNNDTTTRVSVGPSGAQGNDSSDAPFISADGRFVVFASYASNLVAGDTNGHKDIFVHDRATGATTRMSTTIGESGGLVQGNAASTRPSISADGRYVAFESHASNLVANDTNGAYDIFVHDRTAGTTKRVSISSAGGQGNGISFRSSISADGRFVVFCSAASNLVTSDTNGVRDIFVHDRALGTTTRVSVSSADGQGDGDSDAPSISANGRYVVFQSIASNLVTGDTNGVIDIFMRSRTLDDLAIPVYLSANATATSITSGGTLTVNAMLRRDSSAGVGIAGESVSLQASPNGSSSWTNVVDKATSASGSVGFVITPSATTYYRVNYGGKSSYYRAAVSSAFKVEVASKPQQPSSPPLTPAPQVTHLSAKASATKPAYGKATTISGFLRRGSASGAGLAGHRVWLQSKTTGAWKDVAWKTTKANGAVGFAVKHSVKTSYRLRFDGVAGAYQSAYGSALTVTPKVGVGTPTAPKTMKKGKAYTVYGSLKPRHTKNTKPVRIYKYKKVGSKWKSMGYVKAKAVNYKTYTRYKASVKLPSKGTWRLRAYAPKDSQHAATWSAKYDKVKVK